MNELEPLNNPKLTEKEYWDLFIAEQKAKEKKAIVLLRSVYGVRPRNLCLDQRMALAVDAIDLLKKDMPQKYPTGTATRSCADQQAGQDSWIDIVARFFNVDLIKLSTRVGVLYVPKSEKEE